MNSPLSYLKTLTHFSMLSSKVQGPCLKMQAETKKITFRKKCKLISIFSTSYFCKSLFMWTGLVTLLFIWWHLFRDSKAASLEESENRALRPRYFINIDGFF